MFNSTNGLAEGLFVCVAVGDDITEALAEADEGACGFSFFVAANGFYVEGVHGDIAFSGNAGKGDIVAVLKDFSRKLIEQPDVVVRLNLDNRAVER